MNDYTMFWQLRERQARRSMGFSLLELLIVLALIGLMAGLIFPRFANFYSSLERAFERDEIIVQLNRLGFLAYQQGEDLWLQQYPNNPKPLPLELPQGWQIQTNEVIRYRHNGLCAGGALTLVHGESTWSYQLVAPFCQLEAGT